MTSLKEEIIAGVQSIVGRYPKTKHWQYIEFDINNLVLSLMKRHKIHSSRYLTIYDYAIALTFDIENDLAFLLERTSL